MVERKEYLKRLFDWKDEQVIKVVTGIRRCGKSTLLAQYQSRLLASGIAKEQLISINFEELEYEHLLDYRALYQYIKEQLCPGKMTYIFLDEIQKVPSFEKAVDSLYVKENTDLYITGSNAYLLSREVCGNLHASPLLPGILRDQRPFSRPGICRIPAKRWNALYCGHGPHPG